MGGGERRVGGSGGGVGWAGQCGGGEGAALGCGGVGGCRGVLEWEWKLWLCQRLPR